MPRVYLYVVDRDFGFAPNPFHGCCSLATCKPRIRATARPADWIVGLGGKRLQATGRCIFAMRVDEILTFDDYWSSERFFDKRPVRNGSRRMIVGDNIYHRDAVSCEWRQADSHHSNPDGSANVHNLQHDTQVNRVLIGGTFFYFGNQAPEVPPKVLRDLEYRNGRSYRVYEWLEGERLVDWLHEAFGSSAGMVMADPFDFAHGDRRYSVQGNKIR